jgi:hypothetical protein
VRPGALADLCRERQQRHSERNRGELPGVGQSDIRSGLPPYLSGTEVPLRRFGDVNRNRTVQRDQEAKVHHRVRRNHQCTHRSALVRGSCTRSATQPWARTISVRSTSQISNLPNQRSPYLQSSSSTSESQVVGPGRTSECMRSPLSSYPPSIRGDKFDLGRPHVLAVVLPVKLHRSLGRKWSRSPALVPALLALHACRVYALELKAPNIP